MEKKEVYELSIVFSGLYEGDTYWFTSNSDIITVNRRDYRYGFNRVEEVFKTYLDVAKEWKDEYHEPQILDGINCTVALHDESDKIVKLTRCHNKFPDGFDKLQAFLDEINREIETSEMPEVSELV